MGTFWYDHNSVEIDMEDRTLAHFRLVVMAKLRRHESFAFTWEDSGGAAGGWNSIWLHPACSFHFKFLGGRSPRINTLWVEQLMTSANSPAGLVLTREPANPSPLQQTERSTPAASPLEVSPASTIPPILRARRAVIGQALSL